MSVAASRPPASVVAPARAPSPTPTPTPADREPDAAPFAELLRQSRGVERRPEARATPHEGDGRGEPAQAASAPSPSTSSCTSTTADANEVAAPAPEGSPRSDAGRARARSSGSTPRPAAARSAGPCDGVERDRAPGAARGTSEEEDGAASDVSGSTAPAAGHVGRADPRPAEIDLRFGAAARRLAATDIASRGDDAGAAEPGSVDPSGHGGDAASAPRRTGHESVARADTGRSTGRAGRDGDAQASTTPFARILGEPRTADRPAAPIAPSTETTSPLAAPTPAPEARAAAGTENAAAPLAATLATPLESPEFPAAFGVQVSVLVKEGVQQAELHLNPAETGPVSIAITLEGTQAHVEFGADLAATRQAIENGLPALASALRDAGFTLAGGGVAQHSRSGAGRDGHGSSEAGHHRSRQSGTIDATPAVAQRSSHRVAAGGVDLYA